MADESRTQPQPLEFQVNPEFDRSAFEALVRGMTEEYLGDAQYQNATFHLQQVVLAGAYPWTRLVTYFQRDDMPNATFGYWASVWNWVAWFDFHAGPTPDIRLQPQHLVLEYAEALWGTIESALWNPSEIAADGLERPFFPELPEGKELPSGIRWVKDAPHW